MAEDKDLNRDPITDEPGAHPVGTGVGATGGAVAGAAAGSIGGPVGSVVGGVIGAVVGGLAGKAAAEAINPTAEEAHWRDNYMREPYYEQGRSFDDYGPAYMHGVHGRMQEEGDWDTAEPRLASGWANARAGSGLNWEQARPASRAAWERVELQRGGMASDTAVVRASDLAGGSRGPMTGGTDMARAGIGTDQDLDAPGTTAGKGAAGLVGTAQSAGNTQGGRGDVIDALQDLVECCKDGEYGFQACADQVQRQDLKSVFLQRADDCRRGAVELNQQILGLGGTPKDSGSAAGAVHRGWVSVRSTLSSHDDKAVLEEAERGEDNAMARYRKALKQPLPDAVRQVVERQFQQVQRNHDQVRMLRDQFRAAS
ncbi:PA2169 family four-helix-bundle protein [Ramlibacter sp.]|uniref:ferritin-like domain-containing protein n=1 Tax=Ramlibacter sp. TaxID=1917967 RepID=UPI002D5A947D|nr:PA2169 family four-helix-bundle protein [Ramlibacter sp.]HYD77764.1 PA2169 family four-helix-bundle protein [Ramlibacter sp.]